MVRQEDIEYMRRAMELAERGVGFTNPNPMVGAVKRTWKSFGSVISGSFFRHIT